MVRERVVAEKLRRRMLGDINTGSFPAGSRLGSERQLAEHYEVSRSTVRHVLAGLADAGLVRRVPGRGGGTFIAHAKVGHDPSAMAGLPAYLGRQGYAAGSRVLSTQLSTCDDATSRALRLSAGSLVLDIRRIRLADGTPISLDHARFPADRFPGLLELPLDGSLYELLESRFGVAPFDAEVLVEVVHATDDEASLLQVPQGAALLSITRTAFDGAGIPFEFSTDLFRADRTRITMRTPGRGMHEQIGHEGDVVELQPTSGDPMVCSAAG
jgi:GntR family transcriptional regulator